MTATTETEVTDQQLDLVLADLRARLAALPQQRDVATSYAALEQHFAEQSWLMGTVATIVRERATLDEVTPQVASLTAWRAKLERWRAPLARELLDISEQRTHAARARAQLLRLSLTKVDRGLDTTEALPMTLPLDDLMAEDGYAPVQQPEGRVAAMPWLGSLREVDQRLKKLTARERDARERLALALADVARHA
jgi:hypothetical protein